MTNRLKFVTAMIVALMFAAALVMGQAGTNAALKNPAALKEQAPATYKVNFDTSAGMFVVEVHRDWAPNGADRFYTLVKNGFFDNAGLFRVTSGFMLQFGITRAPAVSSLRRDARVPRAPAKEGHKRASITVAM